MYIVFENSEGTSRNADTEKEAQKLHSEGWKVRMNKSNFSLVAPKKLKKK